jgi:AcrR family transcriptional regulator
MAKPLIAVEKIYQASLSILDTDGLSGLSMRKLASALKCSPNTLYLLIGKREELIRQLLHYYFDALELEWAPTSNWQESAFNWATAVRRSLRSHPNLSQLISSQFREVIVNYANRLLKVFRQNSFPEELAMRCCRVIALQVISLSLSELDTPVLKVRRQKQSPKEIAYEDLIISTQNQVSGNNMTRENLHDLPELFENAIRFTIVGIEQELNHYKS